MGSLFDGIGGFIYAGNQVGIKTIWSSEIDPCCEAVTKRWFPNVQQLGDITKIKGDKVIPVNIVCGGSPCQDLSVAGKRAGLAGERSGLYMEQIRIIREMREATNNTYPRYMVWENVPGALSSNKGEDFRAVIEEAARCAEVGVSVPKPKKRNTSGCIVGNGWSIAWRILDAQYWGVPQRRRRIFLVADFGSERAGEILFKPESVRGYFAEGIQERERVADNAKGGINGSDCVDCINPWDCNGKRIYGAKSMFATLNVGERSGRNIQSVCYALDCRNHCVNEISATIQAKENGGQSLNYINPVCYPIDQYQQDARFKLCEDGIAPTMSAKMGTGENCTPMVLERSVKLNRRKYIIRRLTPMECERLQGYPDGWTDVIYKNKHMSDSTRYRMLGNSVAIPCVVRVISGISDML